MTKTPGDTSAQSPRRVRRAGTGVLCLTLLGLTLGALAHVAVHARRLEVAMELGKAHQMQLELAEQHRRLVTEIGMLKDPGRLIGLAHEKLGMGPPLPGAIRAISSNHTNLGK